MGGIGEFITDSEWKVIELLGGTHTEREINGKGKKKSCSSIPVHFQFSFSSVLNQL